MDTERLKSQFQAALAETKVSLVGRQAEIPPELIPCGYVNLVDNTPLASKIINQVAERTKAFPSHVEFVRLPNSSSQKPEAPDIKDPAFIPYPDSKDFKALAPKYGKRKTTAFLKARNYSLALKSYEERHQSHQRLLSQIRTIRAAHSLDERGYIDFTLASLPPDLVAFSRQFFFTPKRLCLKEADRKRHTMIFAKTGAGKSELLKTILEHYLIRDTSTALVVFDPHDKLAAHSGHIRPAIPI